MRNEFFEVNLFAVFGGGIRTAFISASNNGGTDRVINDARRAGRNQNTGQRGHRQNQARTFGMGKGEFNQYQQ
ncbi:MAG: hypothetical protein WBF93_12050 [Pirellulales bacterium]